MKFPRSNYEFRMTSGELNHHVSGRRISNSPFAIHNSPLRSGFTLIEIAICLAIIGFALVAIIGVLPFGMNTQRDNREETVINQDATVLLEAVRAAARGADYLTNNVYAITNYRMRYVNGVATADTVGWGTNYLNTGARIVGVMSTPQFTDDGHYPAVFLPNPGYSNHVIAYVRSLSGLAAEKPPQDNSIMVSDTFTYRVYCVNGAVAFDTNNPTLNGVAKQLAGSLHELRLTFLWPQLPNGNVGSGKQTFRTSVAGQLAADPNDPALYFYRPQYFTNAP
jgi:prepilin-type N-terminal cleavage/methylation domain-containing protein